MTTTHRKCRMCAKPVSRWNKTGLCKPCHAMDPAAREKQREALAAFNRTERMRELAKVKAESLTPHQRTKGLTPETRKRQMITRTERQLARVPRDKRRLYFLLKYRKRMSADEALQVCLEQEKIDLARFRRSLPIKEQEPC